MSIHFIKQSFVSINCNEIAFPIINNVIIIILLSIVIYDFKYLNTEWDIFINIYTYILNKKKYKCGQCTAAFDRSWNLDRHARVHLSKVTNWVCNACQRSFANKQNLKAHFVSEHKGYTMEPITALVQNKSNFSFVFLIIIEFVLLWHNF